ncbi:MAG: hypothetical protein BWY86_01220 [Candidatus Aminicenantes bacterium ADurb.Bin508]|nr:MAG: hypothetical protein BWY86_01220 [Candidatus Aminicenantes bacterium ADurb.Bin508]
MLEASTAPSAAPAPTMVCISSMKRMISPSLSRISFTTAFNLSSNSPLNFAPARRAPMSRARILLFFKESGTSPLTILWANPSTIAVFPTPASPMRAGLFFFFRERTWITDLTSLSLPMTGSSFPVLAISVRSLAYRWRAWNFSSGFWSVTLWLPLNSLRAARRFSSFSPRFLRSREEGWLSSLRMARRRCSVEMYSSLKTFASSAAETRSLRRALDITNSPPLALGSFSSSFRRSSRREEEGRSALARRGATNPSG